MAGANEILISENTHNLVNKDIQSQFFSEITVKGKAHPVKAYQVLGTVSKKVKRELIKASEDGFKLSLDKTKIKNKENIISILEDSIDRLLN
jgi:hypothetical protein